MTESLPPEARALVDAARSEQQTQQAEYDRTWWKDGDWPPRPTKVGQGRCSYRGCHRQATGLRVDGPPRLACDMHQNPSDPESARLIMAEAEAHKVRKAEVEVLLAKDAKARHDEEQATEQRRAARSPAQRRAQADWARARGYNYVEADATRTAADERERRHAKSAAGLCQEDGCREPAGYSGQRGGEAGPLCVDHARIELGL